MNTGKPKRVWTDVPAPVRFTPPPARTPVKSPDRELVPVGPPQKKSSGYLEIIPIKGNVQCPKCLKALSWTEGEGGLELGCSTHGQVLQLR